MQWAPRTEILFDSIDVNQTEQNILEWIPEEAGCYYMGVQAPEYQHSSVRRHIGDRV